MFGLPQKFFLYLLRAAGVFLIHISGMLDWKDELKTYLFLPVFQDTLEYTGYLPHLYLYVLVGIFKMKIYLSNHLILFPVLGPGSPGNSKDQA